jgi:hypothetical protein
VDVIGEIAELISNLPDGREHLNCHAVCRPLAHEDIEGDD